MAVKLMIGLIVVIAPIMLFMLGYIYYIGVRVALDILGIKEFDF